MRVCGPTTLLLFVSLSMCNSNDHPHEQTGVAISCPFNPMCSCRTDTSVRSHSTQHQTPRRYGVYSGFGARDDFDVPYAEVVCIGVPLSKLPDLPRGPVAQVDIANSGLVAVESEPFAGTRVESLRLMNNNIKHIDDKAFSSMTTTLSSLDLAYNSLDAVPFTAIQDLQHLQWLNLHGNQIRSLHGEWSSVRKSLTTLLVGDNDITSLLDKTSAYEESLNLNDFGSLSSLNLNGNKLTRIERYSLPKTVQTLTISHNLLTEFPIDAIEHLHKLQWLYLRGNMISYLPQHRFRTTIRLEKFDIGENRLKIVTKRVFNCTLRVNDLKVDFNELESLDEDIFTGFSARRIVLDHNVIRSIHENCFRGLENTLEYLDLGHNQLIRIPKSMNSLRVLRYLYLSSNMIHGIDDDENISFCENLRALSLSGNYFTEIPWRILSNCTKLIHFNIGYNQILEIRNSDFDDWSRNLDTILLRSNRISALEGNVFNYTMNLRELSLSFNPLNYIDPDAFTCVSETLESLEISFGLLQDNFEMFAPLVNLQWLALDSNNINEFKISSLNRFPILQYLNLESNRIKIIESEHSTEITSNLTDLRLSRNELELIGRYSFVSLRKLKSLSLSGNKIRTIETNAFTNMTDLVKLLLSYNDITKIEPGAFSDLPRLQRLDLQYNKLSTFSMDSFKNTTNEKYPMVFNLSSNHLEKILPSEDILNVKHLDLSYNNLHNPQKRFLEQLSNTLRSLRLDYNHIIDLELEAFGQLSLLNELFIKYNRISTITKHSFLGLDSLQILDISHNDLEQLHVGQFSYMQQLRVLDLSNNRIKYFPKEIFRNTKLEKLDISHNGFTSAPTTVLRDVGSTLRDLKMGGNNIEHIDGTMFTSIPFLLNLDLSSNRLNILPDNVFANLDHLQRLDLSSNPLRANFKELFHYAQSLKHLDLADIGLKSAPTLPLPNLIHLNLSSNLIENTSKYSMKGLPKLKYLSLRNNNLTSIPTIHWTHLSILKTLDVGMNPIKEILSKSFQGLDELQHLYIDSTPALERFETDALAHLAVLTSLHIQTWRRFVNQKNYLQNILSSKTSLRKLSIEITEKALTDQLKGILHSHIKELEIRGNNLKYIHRDAFRGLENNAELILRIRDTSVEELPTGIVANLHRIPHLSIDLRNNMLYTLTPDVFYNNMTNWDTYGTKIVSGGLLLDNNPLICDCRSVWLGHWMRRWLRESLQTHTMSADNAQIAYIEASNPKCRDPDTGSIESVIDLYPESMSCHASALSNSASTLLNYKTLYIRIVFAFFESIIVGENIVWYIKKALS